MTVVAATRSGTEIGDIGEACRRAIELAGGLATTIRPGHRVLVKPNVVAPVPSAVTHPDVLTEVVKAVAELGATVVIGECPGFEYDSQTTLNILRLRRLAESLGVEALNFEKDSYVEAAFDHPMVKKVRVAREAVECDAIVNVPKMKSHKLTDVSLAIKNCFGMIEKSSRREIHAKGLHYGIAALYRLFRPAMTVMDASTVPTAGAVYGDSARMNMVMASTDMLALDFAAAGLLGRDPMEVDHIAIAARGGQPVVDVVGDTIEPLPLRRGSSGWRRRLYRRAFEGLYGFDYYLSMVGAKSIIPWFHTRFGIHPVIDWNRCNRCRDCVRACPVDAIDLDAKRLNYAICARARCMECAEVCPQQAISVKQAFKG